MSAALELLLGGQVVPQMLIEWLDGLPAKGILGDLASQRIEFIPVFLNFLRDQSSSILQIGLTGGLTPNKCSSLVRAIKYVSPGKDPGLRSRARKNYTSVRAKTLKFLESPDKNGKLGESTSVPDVGQLLREAEYPLTVNRGAVTSCLNKTLYCSTPKGTGDRTKSPNQQGYASPKLTSPDYPSGERNSWAKRQSQETGDRGGRGNFNSEKRFSEQRLSLGDFLQSDTKKGIKKRSPLPRDSIARINNNGGIVRQTSGTLDITDENAFPVVGSIPQQEKQPKRRINPTRITPVSASRSNKSNPFGQNSKNMFGFPQGQSPSTSFNSVSEEGSKTLEEEREMLRQERLKWQEVASKDNNFKGSGQDTPPNLPLQKLNGKPSEFKEATLDQVTKKAVLDVIAQVYADLILCNMVPSIMVELYYVIQLLTVRVLDSEESDSDEDSESYLGNLHNCVYFSTKVLSHLLELIKLLDRTTITLLSENPRIQCFCTDLEKQLMKFLENPPPEPLLSQQPKSPIGGVSFQSDTDNRQNFSCDQAFHVFRKQRDSFYEIIRIWEENHLTPGWSFSQSLGPRIRHLLAMRADPTNYAHFARLFQLQLLTMCRGEDVQFDPSQDPEDLGFLTLLKKQHPEKYKRLHERLVTPSKLGGPCPAPSFPGSQEFFKEFIIIAAHGAFNQFLKDVLISHILRLNEQDFIVVEQDERDPVESMVHMEARSVVLNLRLLAKFLGFVEFLPYQTTNHLSENVIATHIDLRSKVCPPLNLNVALRQCAAYGRLVVGVTWIVEYLSMVDPVALHSKHYLTVVMTLIAIFKILYITSIEVDTGCPQCMKVSHSKNLAPSNSLLLKLLLGWLFDLPAFPDGLFFADIAEADIDHCEYNQNLKTIQANYSHFCVLCLRQMLSTEYKEKCMEAKLPVYGICTPSKNKIVKGKSLANTPVKQVEKDVVMSPMKTPSKYMAMSLLDTPDTTPLKPSDSQDSTELIVCLDISHFVDQQLITICCPFVCELKNLLNDFLLGTGSSKNTGSNSCRRITPLSASEKEAPGKAQIDIQLQLEENFFHNHPSSFRKTTDFVIERVSSNIIRNIRLVVIPQLRESATDKLKATVDCQVQNSPVLGDCKKESVKKQVNELSTEMCAQLKTYCLQLPQQEIQEQVNSVLSLLLPSDITPEEVEVCQKLVVRSTMEKVNSWTQSHLTPSQFCKELTLDSERLIRQAQKTADLLAIAGQGSQDDTTLSLLESSDVSALGGETNASGYQSSLSFSDTPLSPSNQPHLPRPVAKKPSALESLPVTAKEHDPDVMPPSCLLKLLKAMVYKLISVNTEMNKVDFASDVQNLIHSIQQVVSKREDVTLTVFRALETLTVDLAVALACCLPVVMTSEIQKAFVSLWRPVEEDGLIPSPCGLSSLMCPRTVMLIAQGPTSKHQDAAWKKMEEFISLLVSSNLISPVSLQEQCVSLLRHSWPEEILAGLSSCIKGISKNCSRQNFADDSMFTELLEWVSWVCGEMEEFPDLI